MPPLGVYSQVIGLLTLFRVPLKLPWEFDSWGDDVIATRVDACGLTIEGALRLAHNLSHLGPQLGTDSWPVLSALATVGSIDLTVARTLEPHLDALAILHQAGDTSAPPPEYADHETWGVYASSPPGTAVTATAPSPAHGNSGDDGQANWTLNGAKPWCSLADRVSHALITASVDGAAQQLFAVSLREDGVRVDAAKWKALGLPEITTGTVHLDQAPATPVGPPGWYLERNGFAWGGVAVAAIWFGAAAAVAAALWDAAARRTPDQIALMHLGACDTVLHTTLLSLREAARAMDDPATTSTQAALLAARTRGVVASAAEQVITTVGHALGPGPLAFDEPHLQRVADLSIYLRQHHAERDQAQLGALVAPESTIP